MITDEERKIIDDSYKAAILSRHKVAPIICDDTSVFDQFNFWGNGANPNCSLNFGDIFLYQTIHWTSTYSHKPEVGEMTYPKLATFIEFLPCDQTLEFRHVNKARTWMWNVEYIANPQFNYMSSVAERGSEIDSFIPWGKDEIYVFGRWASMPDWKQLKRAYEKSFWFYTTKEDLRNRAIDTII